MTKLPKWKRKLTKKQRNHLKDCGITTLWRVKENMKHQDTLEFPCWECTEIARRLGINYSLTTFDERCKQEREGVLKYEV